MAKPTVEARSEDISFTLGELQDAARNLVKREQTVPNDTAYAVKNLASAAMKYTRAVRKASLNPANKE